MLIAAVAPDPTVRSQFLDAQQLGNEQLVNHTR